MYILPLNSEYGYDTVVRWGWTHIEAGDIIVFHDDIYLCLGDTIAFPGLYPPRESKHLPTPSSENQHYTIHRHYIDSNIIAIIHRLAKTYFAAYKHCVALYNFPLPTPQLSHKKKTLKRTTRISDHADLLPQICHIFPDIWMLTQSLPDNVNMSQLPAHTAILHGGMTSTQKKRLSGLIATGEIHTLYATTRGLFMPWSNLSHIIIHASGSWAYTNQSEPRYGVSELAACMALQYNATLEKL